MTQRQQIPTDAMVAGELGQAGFFINEQLEVSMSDGRSKTLSIRLTPEEARKFSQIFAQLAELSEQTGGLSTSECVGQA